MYKKTTKGSSEGWEDGDWVEPTKLQGWQRSFQMMFPVMFDLEDGQAWGKGE